MTPIDADERKGDVLGGAQLHDAAGVVTSATQAYYLIHSMHSERW